MNDFVLLVSNLGSDSSLFLRLCLRPCWAVSMWGSLTEEGHVWEISEDEPVFAIWVWSGKRWFAQWKEQTGQRFRGVTPLYTRDMFQSQGTALGK